MNMVFMSVAQTKGYFLFCVEYIYTSDMVILRYKPTALETSLVTLFLYLGSSNSLTSFTPISVDFSLI